MKRLISLCLVVIALAGLTPINTAAVTVKDGYTLVPLRYTSEGVDVTSPFVLTTPPDTPSERLVGTLTIDGQPVPDIAPSVNGGNEFIVTPVVALSQNTLYIFRLSRDGKDDITWAFQTAKKFQITSSYPYNGATNVPKNSGIEITFSSDGYTPIHEHFSISPHVEGKFEYHKDTAVFVPSALNYSTVYTITIKAGIKLENTGEELLTDYTFAFETVAPPEIGEGSTRIDRFRFQSRYIEWPTTENPSVRFMGYSTIWTDLRLPEINLYKFSNNDQAVQAYTKLSNVPYWAQYAHEASLIDTVSLAKVATFEAPESHNYGRNSTWDNSDLELPDKLTQGFYLLDARYGNARDQMIIQISDLPIQVIADNEQTIIWVNDIGTGAASSRATVYDHADGKTYRADSNGIAIIDRKVATGDSERLTITSTNGKTFVWLYKGKIGRAHV